IDAEWSVELPDDGHPVPTPLLGPGWNVFQYKKRDLEALSLPNFKLIVALPTPTHAHAPTYGRDERVQALHLQPLPDAEARKLLEATGRPLDFDIVDWITRHAGGVPGVLLVAASVGNTLRHDLTSFVEAVGHEFERRIQSELGAGALQCARLF